MRSAQPIQPEDPRQGRDYTYVTDIADGVRTVLDAPVLPHDLYNITAGVWLTFKDILDSLIQLVPSAGVGEVVDEPKPILDHGTTRGPLSGHRLFHDIGWTPKFDILAGLTDYLEWRRSSGFLD